jgi:amino acid adenylation domain-containing protein
VRRLKKSLLNLSSKRLALLSEWLKEEGLNEGASRIEQRKDDGPAPLSFAQQRLWFLSQMSNDASYNMPLAVRIAGELDKDRLLDSLFEIVKRHETLRTTIQTVSEQPVQVVAEAEEVLLKLIDLRHLAHHPAAQQEAAARAVSEDAVRAFDLERGPLMRASLLQLSDTEHVLLLNMHHIISDGWSLNLFLNELTTLYEAGAKAAAEHAALPELPVQYSDYAVWQRESMTESALQNELNFWLTALADAPTVLELPTDRPRPPVQSYRGANLTTVLPKQLTERLLCMARQEHVTPFMLFLAAFNALLARCTGAEDILIGTPVAGRERAETQHLIGLFVNTVVLRTDLKGDPTFRQLLHRVKNTSLEAFSHQDLPFEKLVEAMNVERDTSYHPVFQVWYGYQEQTLHPRQAGGLTWSPEITDNGTAKFDLSLDVIPSEEGMRLSIQYSTDLFDKETIERLSGYLHNLLSAAAEHPDAPLSTLDLLGEEERRQLLVDWNATELPYPKTKCIHELFEAQVLRTPDAIACIDGEARLTYRELDARANRMARRLQQAGLKPEGLAGICLKRTSDLLISMLGVLKAGGAYVPLDPAYPKERLQGIAEDAELLLIVTEERLKDLLPDLQVSLVLVDAERDAIDALSDERVDVGVTPENTAYLIYTSGSTGRPKGVVIEHRNAVNMLSWAKSEFAPEDLEGVLAATSICFDLSVFELFLPLSTGGKVILAENVLHLPSLPAKEEVTLINTVPSAISELLRINGVPSSVRTVNLAGEPLRKSLVESLYQQETIKNVYNLYGPSETTTYSTFVRLAKDDPAAPSIGRPIGNTQLYVLDRRMKPVPIGVPGELYIGGDGVSRGYLRRPEMTQEKYVPDPFTAKEGARLYRTGDLVRYRADGQLEFLGRLDHQVKVRGFRIELGEVETVLGQHPAVRETCALIREEGGERTLVACIVYEAGQTSTVADLRNHLKEKLPDYMVPQAFVVLEAMPLLPNGKVDRAALLKLAGKKAESAAAYVAPETEAERALCAIWQEVLGVERVGLEDNFFELGGHSLLLMRVRMLVEERLGHKLSMTDLFRFPTVARMAKFLTGPDEHPVQQMIKSEARNRASAQREARKRRAQQGRTKGDFHRD